MARTPGRDREDRDRRTGAIVEEMRAGPTESRRLELVDELIEANAAVARSMAVRYRNRGIDVDDLEQVALVGLVRLPAGSTLPPGTLSCRTPCRPCAASCAATSATRAG